MLKRTLAVILGLWVFAVAWLIVVLITERPAANPPPPADTRASAPTPVRSHAANLQQIRVQLATRGYDGLERLHGPGTATLMRGQTTLRWRLWAMAPAAGDQQTAAMCYMSARRADGDLIELSADAADEWLACATAGLPPPVVQRGAKLLARITLQSEHDRIAERVGDYHLITQRLGPGHPSWAELLLTFNIDPASPLLRQ